MQNTFNALLVVAICALFVSSVKLESRVHAVEQRQATKVAPPHTAQ